MLYKALTATALTTAITMLAAFAPLPITPQTGAQTGAFASVNVTETVIHKTNPHWPVRGRISHDPCAISACVEV